MKETHFAHEMENSIFDSPFSCRSFFPNFPLVLKKPFSYTTEFLGLQQRDFPTVKSEISAMVVL